MSTVGFPVHALLGSFERGQLLIWFAVARRKSTAANDRIETTAVITKSAVAESDRGPDRNAMSTGPNAITGETQIQLEADRVQSCDGLHVSEPMAADPAMTASQTIKRRRLPPFFFCVCS